LHDGIRWHPQSVHIFVGIFQSYFESGSMGVWEGVGALELLISSCIDCHATAQGARPAAVCVRISAPLHQSVFEYQLLCACVRPNIGSRKLLTEVSPS
jgi:hypothetical protein